MAERRMFAKSITNSARFLRMPATSRLLYYDLGMAADDDGVVEAFTVLRTTGATEDDLGVLVTKGFVRILNEDLVAVITDWKQNNLIRPDRYKASVYAHLLAGVTVGLPFGIPTVDQMTTEGEPRLGQERVVKERSGEASEGNVDAAEGDACPPEPDSVAKPVAHIRGQYGWVRLTDEQYNRLIQDFGVQAAEDAIGYVDESAQTTGNKNRWKDWNLVIRRCIREGWGKRGSRRDNGFQTSNPFLEMLQERGGDLF